MYTRRFSSNTRGHQRPSAGSSRSRTGGFRKPAPKKFGFPSQQINPARFINKSVITEETEHFKPEHQFQDFGLDKQLERAVVSKGYILPTPIQDKTIGHILKGCDVVGVANTGTGKTGAFLLPLMNKVLLNPRERVLIIVPTRELAIQIDQELKGFARGMRIFSVCCVGGANIGRQIFELRRQNNFVIGTPGRLKDLIERKCIALASFKNVVLDEADRMLEMGFIGDMRLIMAGMPKDRQTLFFSATISPDIQKIIGEFLKEPIKISVKTSETPQNIDQDIIKVKPGNDKIDLLHDLLIQKEFSKVLIFGRTKFGVEKLYKTLVARGFKVESIHGNKNHSKRQNALNLFRADRIQILVATDVAARGLDIADVSHVINYDLPATYDDYVHRIGRTGRGDKKGKALTFIG
jgi:ATP-dependent RNA helicase RhlE